MMCQRIGCSKQGSTGITTWCGSVPIVYYVCKDHIGDLEE